MQLRHKVAYCKTWGRVKLRGGKQQCMLKCMTDLKIHQTCIFLIDQWSLDASCKLDSSSNYFMSVCPFVTCLSFTSRFIMDIAKVDYL